MAVVLLPLLYQLGLGLPAWQSGLLMMPAAIAAMGMKFFSVRVLRRFGFRRLWSELGGLGGGHLDGAGVAHGR